MSDQTRHNRATSDTNRDGLPAPNADGGPLPHGTLVRAVRDGQETTGRVQGTKSRDTDSGRQTKVRIDDAWLPEESITHVLEIPDPDDPADESFIQELREHYGIATETADRDSTDTNHGHDND